MKAKNTIGKIYVSQCLFRTFCKLQSIKQTAMNIFLSNIKRLPSPSHSLGEGSLFR